MSCPHTKRFSHTTRKVTSHFSTLIFLLFLSVMLDYERFKSSHHYHFPRINKPPLTMPTSGVSCRHNSSEYFGNTRVTPHNTCSLQGLAVRFKVVAVCMICSSRRLWFDPGNELVNIFFLAVTKTPSAVRRLLYNTYRGIKSTTIYIFKVGFRKDKNT
jgi:hypothetical protein